MTQSSAPKIWTTPPTVGGEHVGLEPLQRAHADGLRAAVQDGELWKAWYGSTPAPEAMDGYIDAALAMQAAGTALPLIVRAHDGDIVGTTRYYDIDTRTPRLHIGYTWYAARVQRTGLNTQAKLLLLTHAFETLRCIAVGFKTSWFNQPSRTAIARLGAKQDGVLRSHMRHADGSVRDSVVFSIIESEWPAVKRNLQVRLEQGGRGNG